MDVTAIDSNSLTRNSIIITKLSKALLKSANIIPDILVKAITENKQNPLKLDGFHLLATVRLGVSTYIFLKTNIFNIHSNSLFLKWNTPFIHHFTYEFYLKAFLLYRAKFPVFFQFLAAEILGRLSIVRTVAGSVFSRNFP